jgi:hypothetical protein
MPVLRKQRQEDQKFKFSLSYIQDSVSMLVILATQEAEIRKI